MLLDMQGYTHHYLDRSPPPPSMDDSHPNRSLWIAWNGGSMPVPANQMVQFLSPFEGLQTELAGAFNWQKREGAYRIVFDAPRN